LYTQCSHCDTVFQLTADTLRAAGGQVRCGRCGEVFNALARLAEDASAFPAPGESAPGESALEMEARADEILHSPMPTRPAPPEPAADSEDFEATDGEFARLQLIEKFKPPAHEIPAPLRRAVTPGAAPPPGTHPAPGAPPALGAAPAPGAATAPSAPAISAAPPRAPAPKSKPTPLTGAAAAGKSATPDVVRPRTPATGTPIDPESADDGALEFTLPPGELDRIFVDPSAARAHPAPGLGADTDASALNARAADETMEPAAERMVGLDVAEHVRREVLAGLRQRQLDERSEPAPPAARLAWGAAGSVLALVLLGQMLHENRTWLAAHGPLRGPLQGLYAALGAKVQAPVNLSAYQLRQWGVTGDPSAAGTLRLRASILNTSAQLQPYPLLRVTLANRFGTRIGTRDFEPAEYLGHASVRLMTPGERADATLDIQDPGKDAEGFEIDVCLRTDQTVSCAADAATQAGAPQASAPQASAPRVKP
jgi:predicted Zn finger-like uncharacterized protein